MHRSCVWIVPVRSLVLYSFAAATTFVLTMQFNRVVEAKTRTTLWASRGGVTLAPENTIEGMNLTFGFGAVGTEIDIRWTAPDTGGAFPDPVMVLMHDRRVDRTTDGIGPIDQLTFEEVRALDAGSFNGETLFPGAKVPTLVEALTWLKENDGAVNLHPKLDVGWADVAGALAEVDFPQDKIYAWTPNADVVVDAVTNVPGIQPIYQERIDPATADWNEILATGAKGMQVQRPFHCPSCGHFNQAFIDDIHANGLFAFMFAPSTAEFIQAVEWGVDIVQTQRSDDFVPLLQSLQADFDHDDDTDGDDFSIWKASFGIDDGGDADQDGDTDGDDFLIWQAHFGNGSGLGVAVVPEPCSLLLVLSIVVAILGFPGKNFLRLTQYR